MAGAASLATADALAIVPVIDRRSRNDLGATTHLAGNRPGMGGVSGFNGRMASMKQPAEAVTQEVLAGVVERVTFHNVDRGFCGLRLKARGHRDLVPVIGYAATISAGEWATVSGEWINERTHGQQLSEAVADASASISAARLSSRTGGCRPRCRCASTACSAGSCRAAHTRQMHPG